MCGRTVIEASALQLVLAALIGWLDRRERFSRAFQLSRFPGRSV
jgi:hypothetical protein